MDIQAAIANLPTVTHKAPLSTLGDIVGAIASTAMGERTPSASDVAPEAIFEQLEAAARAGEPEIFRELITAETQNRQENTPTILMAAVMAGKTEIVRSLVAAGADINVRIEQFFVFDAMEFAVDKEYPEIVKILLDAGTDLGWQAPVLHPVAKAIEKGNVEILKILLASGIEIIQKSGLNPLAVAAQQSNNPSIMKLLLDADCDVNATNNMGDTALVNACLKGNDLIVPTLLAAGADVNKPRRDGLSPLFAAFCIPEMTHALSSWGLGGDASTVRARMLTIVQTLAEQGADLEQYGYGGKTALMAVTDKAYLDIAQVLIAHGADVNAVEDPSRGKISALFKGMEEVLAERCDRKTALLYATEKGNTAIVKALLDVGADVMIADKSGRTALDIAIQEGYTDIIRLLEGAGAVAPEGAAQFSEEALLGAAKQGNLDVLRSALSAGISPNASELEKGRNPNCKTALMFAAERGHLDAVQVLLSAGAEVNLGDRPGKKLGKTPLMYAAETNHVEIIRLLLEAGAAINAQDKRGPSALLYAVQSKSTEAVQILLEFGADPHQKSWDGTPFEAANYSSEAIAKLMTAAERGKNNAVSNVAREDMLRSAAYQGKVDLVRSLIQEGVNIEAPNENDWTALMSATARGHLAVVQLLLAAGAKVDAARPSGETALSEAAYWGKADILRLLIAAGADPNRQNQCGMTPLMGALAFNSIEATQILLDAGADPNPRNDYGKTALDLALDRRP